MKLCPKCNAESQDDAKFCHVCQETLNPVSSSSGTWMNILVMGAGIVVLIGLLLLLVFPSLFSAFMGKDYSAMVLIPEGGGVGAFYIDKYPVTFDQYDKFCETTGHTKPHADFGRGTMPVVNITWDDAQAYAAWAGKRLPTEAEYERAIRGGTTTDYFWGGDPTQAADYAWYKDDEGDRGMTHPVGEKKSNPYGLCDIVGNIWEWCEDWSDSTQTMRVMRGGSWTSTSYFLRSNFRGWNVPDHWSYDLGFRCAKTP